MKGRQARARCAAAAVTCVLFAAAPATAVVGESPVTESLDIDLTTRPARDAVAIRRAAASGSIAEVLHAAARLGDVGATVDRAAPQHPAPRGGEPGAASVIEDLSAAVRRADVAVRAAVPLSVAPPQVRGGVEWDEQAAQYRHIPRMVTPSLSGVDVASIAEAALDLAAAIDVALPVLAELPTAPVTGQPVDGCDVVDAVPVLCVGSAEHNTYTQEVALLIDLGGDDTYRNSAGGANALTADMLAVSVNIDLAGDDTYDYTARLLHPSQGSAWVGIGILIDAAGDDAYTRRPDAAAPPEGGAGAQGTAGGGVGLLADYAGNDRYTAIAGDNEISEHQGAGNVGGVGVLWDRRGNDGYSLTGGTADARGEHNFERGRLARASGQGFGIGGGTGVLVDEAGTDELHATADYIAPQVHQTLTEANLKKIPQAGAIAQGVGILEGTGLVVTGEGSTTYLVETHGVGLGWQAALGQGSSFNVGGTGVVDDVGGDDEYVLSSSVAATGPANAAGEVRFDPSSMGNPQMAAGQGAVGLPGPNNNGLLAALLDHGGNDRYHAEVNGEVTAVAPPGGGMVRAYAFNVGNLIAQGAAAGSGVAVLVDSDGDDTYTSVVEQAVLGVGAVGDTSAVIAQQVPALLDTPEVAAQGAGGGDATAAALIDRGGTDVYTARLQANAESSGVGRAIERPGRANFQGSGPQGLLSDTDDGLADVFVVEPNDNVLCSGASRGEQPGWVECPSVRSGSHTSPYRYLGMGRVDSAAAKQPSDLRIDRVDADAERGRITVQGRLTAGTDEPLPQRRVGLRLHDTASGSLGGSGVLAYGDPRVWTGTHAMTDDRGHFTAVLHMDVGERIPDRADVVAHFAGAADLRPSLATEAAE